MKVAVLVVSRNRPDLVRQLAGWLQRNMSIDHDLIVVEAGSDADQMTEYSTLHYEDQDFRGKCFAHNVALEHAREQARAGTPYDYYWVLMNDLVFDEGTDVARTLIETMELEPRLGILSPTCQDRKYPSSGRRSGGGWRAVTTCDYLGFMMRAEALEQVGFLNPDFRYCWGAIHELSHKLYRMGWIVAYSDDAEYEHLGGTTYGASGTNTISREEYQVRAKRFAFEYFAKNYGPLWPSVFWAAAQGHGIEIDTYSDHYQLWAKAFQPEELAALLERKQDNPETATTSNMQANQQPSSAPLQLHLGCGPDRREGWLNIDVNPQFQPDIVAPAGELPMLLNGSCAVIESCHLFEHLTLKQARAALREWRRLLGPGGNLYLELPNLARCLELVGTNMDGHDLGMISIFGYPPEIDEQGEPQLHKWGWTPESLAAELQAAGFANVQQVPITQTERPAAKFDRDMRLVASVAQMTTHEAPQAATLTPTQTISTSADDELTSDAATEGLKVFGWPSYSDTDELDQFFGVFARVLSGRDDVSLQLRVDPQLDPPRAQVMRALEDSHGRILGSDAALDIGLLEGPLTPEDWRELGQLMICRVRCNSEAAPRDAARQMATPVVADAAGLYELVNEGSSCAGNGPGVQPSTTITAPAQDGIQIPTSIQPDAAIVARIQALHPWFYPVKIDGMTVTPGIGSVCAPDWLTNRAACRATLLVEEVLKRIDFRGKSVLDLACNCGFWSSYYATAGATRLLGVEGRAQHVAQAELYWQRNQFLPTQQYEFLEGNIADASTWEGIRSRGPWDVTLCAGILYHIENYAQVLAWAAEVTNEVMIIDTRVQDGEEQIITEPGDLAFNAIAETRDKIVPDRTRLLQAIRQLGFEPEVMTAGFSRQLGVDDVDSYADGSRVTIVARKLAVPQVSNTTHFTLSSGSGENL